MFLGTDKVYDVFISYRRSGGDMYSCYLYEKLLGMGYLVFRDKQSLGSGFYDENLIFGNSRIEKSLVIDSELSQRYPEEPDFRRGLSVSLDRMGDWY